MPDFLTLPPQSGYDPTMRPGLFGRQPGFVPYEPPDPDEEMFGRDTIYKERLVEQQKKAQENARLQRQAALDQHLRQYEDDPLAKLFGEAEFDRLEEDAARKVSQKRLDDIQAEYDDPVEKILAVGRAMKLQGQQPVRQRQAEAEAVEQMRAADAEQRAIEQTLPKNAFVREAVVGSAAASQTMASRLARMLGQGEAADELNRQVNTLNQGAAQTRDKDWSPYLSRQFGGAVQSLIGTASTPGGPMLKIGGAAFDAGNQALTTAEDAGLTGTARLRYAGTQALLEGGVAAVFQKMGLGGAESRMAGQAVAAQTWKQLAKNLGKDALQEVPEEVMTAVLQDVSSKLEGVTDAGFGDMVSNATDAAVQALLMSGLTNTPNAARLFIKSPSRENYKALPPEMKLPGKPENYVPPGDQRKAMAEQMRQGPVAQGPTPEEQAAIDEENRLTALKSPGAQPDFVPPPDPVAKPRGEVIQDQGPAAPVPPPQVTESDIKAMLRELQGVPATEPRNPVQGGSDDLQDEEKQRREGQQGLLTPDEPRSMNMARRQSQQWLRTDPEPTPPPPRYDGRVTPSVTPSDPGSSPGAAVEEDQQGPVDQKAYRGTRKAGGFSGAASAGLGTQFATDSSEYASQYGDVSEVPVQFSNPYYMPLDEFRKFDRGAEASVKRSQQRAQELSEAGHDGIVVKHHDGVREFITLPQPENPAVSLPAGPSQGREAQPEPQVEAVSPVPASQGRDKPLAESIAPLIRLQSKPVNDIHGEPTGWLMFRDAKSVSLVHPTENKIVPFYIDNQRSGTEQQRRLAEAQAYAIDNPVEQGPKGEAPPAGELVIKPVFQGQDAPVPVSGIEKARSAKREKDFSAAREQFAPQVAEGWTTGTAEVDDVPARKKMEKERDRLLNEWDSISPDTPNGKRLKELKEQLKNPVTKPIYFMAHPNGRNRKSLTKTQYEALTQGSQPDAPAQPTGPAPSSPTATAPQGDEQGPVVDTPKLEPWQMTPKQYAKSRIGTKAEKQPGMGRADTITADHRAEVRKAFNQGQDVPWSALEPYIDDFIREGGESRLKTRVSDDVAAGREVPAPVLKRYPPVLASTAASKPAAKAPWQEKLDEIKRENGDALVLFRMGDFYEMFGDDAKKAAKTLGLTLTSRDKSSDNPIPMAGFPYHALEGYLHKLVKSGHRVAVAEDPTGKKDAKRNITVTEPTSPVTKAVVEPQKPLQGSEAEKPVSPGAKWTAAQAAYRSGRIGDEEFLAAKKEWDANQAAFDRDRGEAELEPDRTVNAHEIVGTPNPDNLEHDKIDWLADQMDESGWNGPPVLAWHDEQKDGYVAWNGSHRIHVARRLGLKIPIRELDEQRLIKAGKKLKINPKEVNDEDRIRILEKAGYHQESVALSVELHNRDKWSEPAATPQPVDARDEKTNDDSVTRSSGEPYSQKQVAAGSVRQRGLAGLEDVAAETESKESLALDNVANRNFLTGFGGREFADSHQTALRRLPGKIKARLAETGEVSEEEIQSWLLQALPKHLEHKADEYDDWTKEVTIDAMNAASNGPTLTVTVPSGRKKAMQTWNVGDRVQEGDDVGTITAIAKEVVDGSIITFPEVQFDGDKNSTQTSFSDISWVDPTEEEHNKRLERRQELEDNWSDGNPADNNRENVNAELTERVKTYFTPTDYDNAGLEGKTGIDLLDSASLFAGENKRLKLTSLQRELKALEDWYYDALPSEEAVVPVEKSQGSEPTVPADTGSQSESPAIPKYIRTGPASDSPEIEAVRAKREQYRTEETDAYEWVNKLSKERDKLKRNATKKRKELDEAIRHHGERQRKAQISGTVQQRIIDKARIEDILEKPRTYDHYLKAMSELHDLDVYSALDDKNDAQTRTDQRRGERDGAVAFYQDRQNKAQHESERYSLELVDRAKSLAANDGTLNDGELQAVAEEAYRGFSFLTPSLQESVDREIKKVKAARKGGRDGAIERLYNLGEERQDAYKAELAEAEQGGKDWREKSEAILERAKKEATGKDEERKAESERVLAETRAATEKLKAEREAAERVRGKELAAEKRAWKRLSERTKEAKWEKETYTVKEGKDNQNVSEVQGEVFGPFGVREVVTRDDGGVATEKWWTVTHLGTGKPVSSYKTKANARSLAVWLTESGVQWESPDIATTGNITGDDASTAKRWIRAFDDNDLRGLNPDEKAAILKASGPKASGVEADLILDAADLGVGSKKEAPFVKKAREMASAVPEFAYNPVFTVQGREAVKGQGKDKWGREIEVVAMREGLKLVFQDGVKFAFNPEVFGLESEDLTPGQTVGINLEDLGIKRLDATGMVAAVFKEKGFQVSPFKEGGKALTAKWKPSPYGGKMTILSLSANDDGTWYLRNDSASRGTQGAKIAQQVLDGIRWLQPGQAAKGQGPSDVAPENAPTLSEKAAKATQEMKDAAKAFKKSLGGGTLPSIGSFSAEQLQAFTTLTVKAVNAGVLNFADYVVTLSAELGDMAESLRPLMTQMWPKIAARQGLDPSTEESPKPEKVEASGPTLFGDQGPPIEPPVDDAETPDDAGGVPNPTATKHADSDATREAMGLPPRKIHDPEGHTFEDLGERARKAPSQEIDELIAELADNPRTLDGRGYENALLLRRATELNNQYKKAVREKQEARDAGDSVKVVERDKAKQIAIEQRRMLADILDELGSRAGSELNARKMMMNDDYSVAHMEMEYADEHDGKAPSDAQVEEWAKWEQQVKDLQEQVTQERTGREAAEQALALEKAHNAALDRAEADKKAKEKSSVIQKGIERGRKHLEDGFKLLGQMRGKVYSIEGAAVDLTKALTEIVRGYAEIGVFSFADAMKRFAQRVGTEAESMRSDFKQAWDAHFAENGIGELQDMLDPENPQSIGAIAKRLHQFVIERDNLGKSAEDRDRAVAGVHELLGEAMDDLTLEQTARILSGKDEPTRKLSEEEIRTEHRAQLQILEDIQSWKNNERPNAIQERRPDSDEQRKLRRIRAEAKKNAKVPDVRDPAQQLQSALDSAKTSTKNRIADLNEAIKTGQRIMASKTVLIPDAELVGLRAERDTLQAAYDEAFGKKEMSDEQRAAMLEKALDRQIAQLEADIPKGVLYPPAKQPKLPITNPAIAAKKAQRDALVARRDELRLLSPETAKRELEAREKALTTQWEKLKAEKEAGKLWNDKEHKAKPTNERIAALEEAIGLSLAERDHDRKNSPEYQAREMAYYERVLAGRVQFWQNRINEGDFAPKAPKEPRKLTDSQMTLQHELEKAKDKFANEQEKWRIENRTATQKVKDFSGHAWDFWRDIKSTGELSPFGRQGLMYVAGHWLRAGKAIAESIGTAFATDPEHALSRINQKILDRPNAKAGLYKDVPFATKLNDRTSQQEVMIGEWAKRIPLFGSMVKRFGTAGEAFLNIARADMMDSMLATLGVEPNRVSKDEAKFLANAAGVLTGRGNLDPGTAKVLNRVLYSSLFTMSRIETVIGRPLWKQGGSARARMAIAKEYVRSAVGLYLMDMALKTALMALPGDDEEDEVTIETNTTSTDFGKLKAGRTRIDTMGGLQQTLVLLERLRQGQKTKSGVVEILGSTFGGDDENDLLSKFARSRLHPTLAMVWDRWTGENAVGEKTRPLTDYDPRTSAGLKNIALENGPMAYGDMLAAADELGYPRGLLAATAAFFGSGLSTYGNTKAEDQRFLTLKATGTLTTEDKVKATKGAMQGYTAAEFVKQGVPKAQQALKNARTPEQKRLAEKALRDAQTATESALAADVTIQSARKELLKIKSWDEKVKLYSQAYKERNGSIASPAFIEGVKRLPHANGPRKISPALRNELLRSLDEKYPRHFNKDRTINQEWRKLKLAIEAM